MIRDRQQHLIMQNLILAFEQFPLTLENLLSFTQSLEALINTIEHKDKESFRTLWWEFELVSAVMLDEEREEFTDEEKEAIATALSDLKKLIERHLQPSPMSSYDYLYHEMKDKNPDVYFALLGLFWPAFLTQENGVFLKEVFSEERWIDLKNQQKNIEYWMNLLSLDSYFEQLEDGFEKAGIFAKYLAEIWKVKLKQEFPKLDFIVRDLKDEDTGDVCLTFYQSKYE